MDCIETEAAPSLPLRTLARIAASPFRALARLIRRERAWFAGLARETVEEWGDRQF